MKILVTGGTGYIGSHTCVELLAAGYEVVIADNLSNSSIQVLERIRKITGRQPIFKKLDMRDPVALQTLCLEQPVEAVIHFAGIKAVAESVADPLKYYDNNVSGSIKLLSAVREHGVKTFIFSSSATVYGEAAISPIREEAPTAPANPYGRTKLVIEEMLQDQCHADPDFRAAALRYFNPVGAHPSGLIGEAPQGTPNNLMPYICQVAGQFKKELAIFGNDYSTPDGTAIRDYIHIVDLAQGHLRALNFMNGQPGFTTINLGTGHGTSVLELVHAFERVNRLKIAYRFTSRRPGDTAVSYADPAHAARLMNWQTRLGLDDMCRDAWNWQRMNPHGYDQS